ncbi:hypothetical protein THAOC_00968 [Thalassiosira oceanica]|uniref:Uncharacterized protein n=1 Tax=Thalassiosira oceanica TaxID=159749 RepID=K0TR56_THAOC|nr:hypothetical protein THAOC_00968 [Thalassiosira oceanica]|eukprot:EJK77212.1 hypothetical protein THAOC_00968 [Thalassiosira oceanica]
MKDPTSPTSRTQRSRTPILDALLHRTVSAPGVAREGECPQNGIGLQQYNNNSADHLGVTNRSPESLLGLQKQASVSIIRCPSCVHCELSRTVLGSAGGRVLSYTTLPSADDVFS